MRIYTVILGDTLSSIASRLGVPISRLRSDNGIEEDRPLIVGEDLVVTYPSRVYVVKEGDSLFSIAGENGLTVQDLLRNNPALRGIPIIYPGQTLVLTTESSGRSIIVNGYAYPFIEEDVLRRILPYLTYLTVFTYGFTDSGDLISADDERILEIASGYDVAPVLLLSTLGEDGKFNNESSSRLFASPELQERLITQLLRTMTEKGYRGLEVDFEFIKKDDSDGYVAFLSRLKSALADVGYPLFVALAPKTSADQPGLLYEGHDYPKIGAVADYVILMTYEWGYQFGPPGAVAPIRNVERVVQYAITEIPPEKILLGIPNYGYDWPLPYTQGESEASGISIQKALETAIANRAEIIYDQVTQTPFFEYRLDGQNHVVWFENARSIYEKMKLVDKYGLAGISIWQVMRYFPQLYRILNEVYIVQNSNRIIP